MKNKKNYLFGVISSWYPAGKILKTNTPTKQTNKLSPCKINCYVEEYMNMLMKFKPKLSYLFSLMEKKKKELKDKKLLEEKQEKRINDKKRHAHKKKR